MDDGARRTVDTIYLSSLICLFNLGHHIALGALFGRLGHGCSISKLLDLCDVLPNVVQYPNSVDRNNLLVQETGGEM